MVRTLSGRYQLERLVAVGGMGAVWEAHDLRLDRRVAVKVLAAHSLTDATALERFEREARTVARLNHPNVVAVFDFGTDSGDPYLVMEFVDGPTVADLLAGGPLALGQALAIAAQTCDGLGAAHAAGVIHRDVKPRNLILTPAGIVKICDFGIARLHIATGQASLTGTAEAMGSSSYMAPEQVNSDPVDDRTDLYGLGCTLFAMLTGGPPFVAPSPVDVAHLQVTQSPPSLLALRPDAPADLATLVDDLLAKSPQLRPSEAAEVKARLADLVAELPNQRTTDLQLAAVPEAAAAVRLSAPAVEPPAADIVDEPVPPERPGRRRAAVRAGALLAALVVPAVVLASWLRATADTPPNVVLPAAPAATSATTPLPQPSAVAPPATPTTAPASPDTVDQPDARTLTPPQPTPAAPPPATRTSAPAELDPIAGMRQSIQQQLTAGNLTPQSATDLNKQVDDFERKLAEGNTREATRKAHDLRQKITKLYNDGKLPDDGYQTLLEGVSRLDALVSP
jgi:serine/threonine-protein kinase